MGLFGSIVGAVQAAGSGLVNTASNIAQGNLGGAVAAFGAGAEAAAQQVGAGVTGAVADPLGTAKELPGLGIATAVAPISSTIYGAGLGAELFGKFIGSDDLSNAGRTARNAVADLHDFAYENPGASAAVIVAAAAIPATGGLSAPVLGGIAASALGLGKGAVAARAGIEAHKLSPQPSSAPADTAQAAAARVAPNPPQVRPSWPGLWPVVRDFVAKVLR